MSTGVELGYERRSGTALANLVHRNTTPIRSLLGRRCCRSCLLGQGVGLRPAARRRVAVSCPASRHGRCSPPRRCRNVRFGPRPHLASEPARGAPTNRPSGALRCGDLLCQFRLTTQPCQSILTGMDIEKLSVNLSSDDPAIGLRASLALHRLAERVEANHVASAREKGWSWQQIGDALGVTRQSVHTKYNKESS